jgi:hypothetical protein
MMSKTRLNKQEWIEHLSNQERSAATQRAYCREHGLSLSAFRYWKKRETREAAGETKAFIEIPTPGKKSSSPYNDSCAITFPNGCSLRVRLLDAQQDLHALAALVKSL